MKTKYLWWKEIVLGPFSDDEIINLKMDKVEKIVDRLLEINSQKTKPFTQDMIDNPLIPHIIQKGSHAPN